MESRPKRPSFGEAAIQHAIKHGLPLDNKRDRELQYLKYLYETHETDREVAAAVGITVSGLRFVCARLGVSVERSRKPVLRIEAEDTSS